MEVNTTKTQGRVWLTLDCSQSGPQNPREYEGKRRSLHRRMSRSAKDRLDKKAHTRPAGLRMERSTVPIFIFAFLRTKVVQAIHNNHQLLMHDWSTRPIKHFMAWEFVSLLPLMSECGCGRHQTLTSWNVLFSFSRCKFRNSIAVTSSCSTSSCGTSTSKTRRLMSSALSYVSRTRMMRWPYTSWLSARATALAARCSTASVSNKVVL